MLLFGLINVPSTFSRLMNIVLHDMIEKYILMYLDDILVDSESST